MDFEGLTARSKRPQSSVQLCLRGDLFAERAQLNRELAGLQAADQTLAGDPSRTAIKERLADLDEQMTADTVTFTFTAVARPVFGQLAATDPIEDDIPSPGFLRALAAASLTDPVLTPEQFGVFADGLSKGQNDHLELAAWTVNNETVSVPFTAGGSGRAQP